MEKCNDCKHCVVMNEDAHFGNVNSAEPICSNVNSEYYGHPVKDIPEHDCPYFEPEPWSEYKYVRAMEQLNEIREIIEEMIEFVNAEFGWKDFEIYDFGSGTAKFWIGCIIREKDNVCVYDKGLSYVVTPEGKGWNCPIAGYVRFDCEVGGLLSGIFDEYVLVISGKGGFWVVFKRLDEKR